MKNIYQEQNSYFKVKKRLGRIKAFYLHLLIYLTIIPTIIFINLGCSPEIHWFWYSVIGGGIPLLVHALKVFVYNANWEERKIQAILNKKEKNK